MKRKDDKVTLALLAIWEPLMKTAVRQIKAEREREAKVGWVDTQFHSGLAFGSTEAARTVRREINDRRKRRGVYTYDL